MTAELGGRPRLAGRRIRNVLAALALLGLAACASVKTFEIDSPTPARQVIIDGRADDWAGRLFIIKGAKVSLGFLNGPDSLYVCLRTDDPGLRRQILRSGLTVWFDPAGGRNKVLGIKHPVGLRSSEEKVWTVEEPEQADAPEWVSSNLTEVEILRRGETGPVVMDIAGAAGFEIKASAAGRDFVYELRLPLAKSGGGAVRLAAAPGGTIGIGFETGKSSRYGPAGRPGGMGGAGGVPPVGGYGGRTGGMGRGRMRPNNPDLPENLRLWATVKLSRGTDPAPAEVRSLPD